MQKAILAENGALPRTVQHLLWKVRCAVCSYRAGLSYRYPVSRTDPATNQVLGHVSDMGVAETKEAIAVAKTAFKSWSQTTPRVGRIFQTQHQG